jgi:hypothetical protein
VSIAFETLPLKSTFLFSGGESLDVRNILRDQYRDFSLIITSEEDRFFIVRAEKDSKVYDYHIIFTDGTSSLITTV